MYEKGRAAPPLLPSVIQDVDESLFSRGKLPSGLGDKFVFDKTTESHASELSNWFSGTSTPLSGMYRAKVPNGRIAIRVIEKFSNRDKSDASIRGEI